MLVRLLNKPEYLWRPGKLLRRLAGASRQSDGVTIVKLPWGLPLEVDRSEAIGRTIAHHGLFEMSAVEAIFRLVDPGEVFLDVGANIGFMSSAALGAGAGRVLAFEPHPQLFSALSRNASRWVEASPQLAGRVALHQAALSSRTGTALLQVPQRGFSGNRGISSLETGTDADVYAQVEVPTITLEEIVTGCGGLVGVLKIDIEGHELQALSGGKGVLASGMVRDIIFEDHQGPSSPVARLLASLDYRIFALNKTLFGPVLLDSQAAAERFAARSDESLNYLATRAPDRARKRMAGGGYRCLRRRPI